ncbi:hypothetical protein ACFFJY_19710 [Fictibacillus aquaticus]|uniref:HTH merR-type domain-containing protein n=1 Tax=Fictibacillus aquaticus TaxID=2021314 RepID=A0A235F509_9BACL|nr:hypothetical protein [Fictibacillus aquaticus]OYD56376.1 hypothetical protein CGZ90_17635 [Fictibacillus aquaticus]
MRRDIQQNERAFSSKEVAEEVGIATPTVRKYGQILERNGYEFLKDGDRRIFVQSDITALTALRDTDKQLDDAAKDLASQQSERLTDSIETDVAIFDTYESLPQDPNQLKEFLMLLGNELAAAREMNVKLASDMSELKQTVSRLQQDHHVISSAIGNASQKTTARIERLTEQQKDHYEALLQQEQEKSELLQKELQELREEQIKEWRAQNDFNTRLEEAMQNRPEEKRRGFFGLFRK